MLPLAATSIARPVFHTHVLCGHCKSKPPKSGLNKLPYLQGLILKVVSWLVQVSYLIPCHCD